MSNLDILNSKNQSFFLPIGGIGEIGGNNYLYSFKGEQIIVDAGISFADDSLPGVDITIPVSINLNININWFNQG